MNPLNAGRIPLAHVPFPSIAPKYDYSIKRNEIKPIYCRPLIAVPDGPKRKETVNRSSFPGGTGRSMRARNEGMLSIDVLLITGT